MLGLSVWRMSDILGLDFYQWEVYHVGGRQTDSCGLQAMIPDLPAPVHMSTYKSGEIPLCHMLHSNSALGKKEKKVGSCQSRPHSKLSTADLQLFADVQHYAMYRSVHHEQLYIRCSQHLRLH